MKPSCNDAVCGTGEVLLMDILHLYSRSHTKCVLQGWDRESLRGNATNLILHAPLSLTRSFSL
eukprot:1204189-Pyramimonas_sp.AAC.1